MTPSLDRLVEFLLEEIALSGEKGLDLSDLVKTTSLFHKQHHTSQVSHASRSDSNRGLQHRSPVLVDRKFIGRVWKWLGQHPDILIGRDAQFNGRSLEDVDSQFPGYITAAFSDQTHSGATTVHQDHLQAAQVDNQSIDDENAKSTSRRNSLETGPRIFVTEDRMFLAICGHLPDPTRVFPSEWKLLSHIAGTRYEGVLQGELGRVTGQDKRSVPKRTNVLHEKGYIVKKTVYIKGNKTSRLFLQRFATPGEGEPENGHSQGARPVEKLTVKYQSRQIFEILRTTPLIAQEELANQMGMKSSGKRKVLTLLLRHFGRAGCIKRVRTSAGSAQRSEDLKICVQYLREPVDTDWSGVGHSDIDFEKSLEELVAPIEAVTGAQEAEEDGDLDDDSSDEENDSQLERVVPQWNPDRILANVILEAVRSAGSQGLRNIDIRRMITGPFVRRVLESLIVKLSHQSLQSQPRNLRHLTVLRSKQNQKGMLQYVHYALDCLGKSLAHGRVSISDIEGDETILQEWIRNSQSTIDALEVTRDAFGFPTDTETRTDILNEYATEAALVRQAKVKDVKLNEGDLQLKAFVSAAPPQIHEQQDIAPDQTVKAKRGRPKKAVIAPSSENHQDEAPKQVEWKEISEKISNRGRPRKFLKGTEKFWRDMFLISTRRPTPGSDTLTGAGKSTQDPAGMNVFKMRPNRFDETLVRAIGAEFPVPRLPEDITESWIEETLAALDSPDGGVYFTQTGMQPRSRIQLSKIMVVKSVRLKGTDWLNRQREWAWQFLSSNASHSQRHIRFYPRLEELSQDMPSITETLPCGHDHVTISQSGGSPREPSSQDVSHLTKTPCQNSQEIIVDPPSVASITGHVSGPHDVTVDSELQLGTAGTNDNGNVSNLYHASSAHHDGVEADVTTDNVNKRLVDASPSEVSNSKPLLRSTRRRQLTQKAAENAGLIARQADSALDPFKQAAHNTDVSTEQPPPLPEDFENTRSCRGLDRDVLSSTPVSAINSGTSFSLTRLQSEQTREDDHLVAQEEPVSSVGDVNLILHGEIQQEQRIPQEYMANADQLMPTQDGVTDLTAEEQADEDVLLPPAQNASTTTQKRRLDTIDDDSDGSIAVRPPKRPRPDTVKPKISQKEPARLCRSVILDLLDLCSGLAPNDPWTFRRAITTRWIESGVELDPPSAKNVRTNLRALSNSTAVRMITFAYRGKSGAMVTKGIIALRKYDHTSPEVIDLQRKMTQADPEDYVPPELVAEFDRVPSTKHGPRMIRNEPGGAKLLSTDIAQADHTAVRGTDVRTGVDITISASPSSQQETLDDSRYMDVSNRPNEPSRAIGDSASFRRDIPSKRRTTKVGDRTRNLVWATGRQTTLPQSLDDVPNIARSRYEATLFNNSNPRYALFCAEIECVAGWEQSNESTTYNTFTAPSFINHNPPAESIVPVSYDGSVRFEYITSFDKDGNEIKQSLPLESSWQPFSEALSKVSESGRNIESLRNSTADLMKRRKTNVQRYEGVSRRRIRQRSTEMTSDPKIPVKFRRPTRIIRDMPEELQYRIVVAVIVVRTLVGGLEGLVDWQYVYRLIPECKQPELRSAWKTLSSRYRSDVDDLTFSFQDKYLEALSNWKVPTINYDDLDGTDWEGILEWALQNLEKLQPVGNDELPANRADFDRLYTISTIESANIRDTFRSGINTSQSRREELMAGIVFGTPLTSSKAAVRQQISSTNGAADYQLQVAKSWIISLLLTPMKRYNPKEAHKTLLKLAATPHQCERLVEEALASLQREKSISKLRDSNSKLSTNISNNEISGVRTWQVSAKYYDNLTTRRHITSSILKVAAKYKLDVLDTAFSQGQTVTIEKEATPADGEMVAIINLLSMGAIRLSPGSDFPDTRYGLDWENQGYSTRLIDKSILHFSTIIEAVPYAYEYGDVFDETRAEIPIPRGELDGRSNKGGHNLDSSSNSNSNSNSSSSTNVNSNIVPDENNNNDINRQPNADASMITGRIPPWFDIHLNFLPDQWSIFTAAIIGLISIRPGINAQELSKSIGGVLAEYDIESILEYLIQLGGVSRTESGRGFETLSWWWMCIGGDDNNDNDDDDNGNIIGIVDNNEG